MGKKKVELENKKYENAILYILKYCNNQYLGATKLNKLLYYLDFISYRDKGKPVTGDEYRSIQYGPVPGSVDTVIENLQSKGAISVERITYKDNGTFQYKISRNPDTSVFDSYEKNLLEKICKEFELWDTEKIVTQTHLEAPWFYSKPYETVDYEYSKDIEFFRDEED